MKIICDIDNVIVDWQGSWIRKYEIEFQRRVPWATRARWDAYSTGTHFLTYSTFSQWLGGDFWFTLNGAQSAIPGAEAALRAIAHRHDVLLATHRPEGAPQQSAKQLADYLGFDVVFATPCEKAQLDGDVWIDDAPELMWELQRVGKQGIRFVCPWNEGAPGLPMTDWCELPSTLVAVAPTPVTL